jgi:pyridoxamine 5'-phosphate oxidase
LFFVLGGDLERQVRVEGRVERVSNDESDTYFQSRPRGSQIGAWTSAQSQPISSRQELEEQERAIVTKFQDTNPIPRPPHWGGFRLVPNRVEFWKGRESRLHDRLVFERDLEDVSNVWTLTRLQP